MADFLGSRVHVGSFGGGDPCNHTLNINGVR